VPVKKILLNHFGGGEVIRPVFSKRTKEPGRVERVREDEGGIDSWGV